MNINIAKSLEGVTTEVVIATGDRCAKLINDLNAGRVLVELVEGDALLRSEVWTDTGPQAATNRLLADLRCSRFVGMSFSTAEDLFSDENILCEMS